MLVRHLPAGVRLTMVVESNHVGSLLELPFSYYLSTANASPLDTDNISGGGGDLNSVTESSDMAVVTETSPVQETNHREEFPVSSACSLILLYRSFT